MDVVLTDHAKFETNRRQLSEETVISVAQAPEQFIRLPKGRRICQSKYYDSQESKEMLLRVVCEEKNDLLLVVTAYRTSKIDKYWVEDG